MNLVQPIRDHDTIAEIKKHLKARNERDYILFLVGIMTGLRISDILALRVGDMKKSHINLKEKKTRKFKAIEINPVLKREIKPFLDGKEDDEYLIKSRQGINKPLSREMAYKILKKVAAKFRLDNIGTHTLRKTMGYHFYKQTQDIALLQEIFNHSSEKITLRYIGITQDTIDEAMRKFKI